MRYLICIALLVLSIDSANAQILNMSGTQDRLNVPTDFLKSISECTPYETTVLSAPEGVETKMIYRVIGKISDKCKIQIDGYTNVNVHIRQSCLLSEPQATEYASSISRFQSKQYLPRKHMKRMLHDEDYLKATEIMTNENICTFHRDRIDTTAEFRKKLSDCTPYSETQKLDSVDINREIKEKINDICKINITFTQRLPNMELRAKKISPRLWSHIDKFKEANYHYACAFNDDKRYEYTAILEALIVPEENGFDFSAVQRFSQSSEIEFIYKNCTYVIK